ncbi:MAG: ATP-binding cassette domain-containing protein [Betaproteobacteria bacterium]|nr:ATP-binding cassette domain-containing protein [Betaproteobacteria bacterium]
MAPVLDGISLDVAENELVVLLGRSGCGKTTLLNIIAGLELASSVVRVDGTAVSRPGSGKGMVFQQAALFPWLTAIQNVAFAARKKQLSAAKVAAVSRELLALVGLAGAEGQVSVRAVRRNAAAGRHRARWRWIRRSC